MRLLFQFLYPNQVSMRTPRTSVCLYVYDTVLTYSKVSTRFISMYDLNSRPPYFRPCCFLRCCYHTFSLHFVFVQLYGRLRCASASGSRYSGILLKGRPSPCRTQKHTAASHHASCYGRGERRLHFHEALSPLTSVVHTSPQSLRCRGTTTTFSPRNVFQLTGLLNPNRRSFVLVTSPYVSSYILTDVGFFIRSRTLGFVQTCSLGEVLSS